MRIREIPTAPLDRRDGKEAGWLLELGPTDYDEALRLQLRCEAARKRGAIPDLLMLLEHPPVYTMGRGTDPANLLLDPEDLEARGVALREVRRGGDITFHGPGQLVGYPILDLRRHGADAHLYLRRLERLLIQALAAFELDAYTVEGMTGVWCGGGKIASIGVGISRWVTTHGFALNANTDLDFFAGIVACGLRGRQATSMRALLGRTVDMVKAGSEVARSFFNIFDIEPVCVDLEHLRSAIARDS